MIPRSSRSGGVRPSVCLYWFHPLLWNEFEQRGAAGDFRLKGIRLESETIPYAKGLSCPPASVYVVEALPRRLLTESIVLAIREAAPDARILVVAEGLSESNVFPLLRLGVRGLVTYGDLPSQIAQAARVVSGGGFWVPRALLSGFLDKIRSDRPRLPALEGADLTERERQVLEGLLQNLLNKEIAKKLKISERTAKFHVSNLLAKFGVRRRADLILLSSTPTSVP